MPECILSRFSCDSFCKRNVNVLADARYNLHRRHAEALNTPSLPKLANENNFFADALNHH